MKAPRTLTAEQIYSRTNYSTKVQSDVRAEIEKNHIPKEEKINVIKRRTRECFLAEPIEVQEHFKSLSTQMKEERAKKKKNAEVAPTAASYAA